MLVSVIWQLLDIVEKLRSKAGLDTLERVFMLVCVVWLLSDVYERVKKSVRSRKRSRKRKGSTASSNKGTGKTVVLARTSRRGKSTPTNLEKEAVVVKGLT